MKKRSQREPARARFTIGPKVAYWAFVRSVRRLYTALPDNANTFDVELKATYKTCMKGLESEYPRNAFRVAMANKGTLAGTILSPTEIVPWLSLANEKIPEWVGALCLVTGHLGIILIVVTFGGMQTVASYERIIDSYKKTKRSPIHFGKRNQHVPYCSRIGIELAIKDIKEGLVD